MTTLRKTYRGTKASFNIKPARVALSRAAQRVLIEHLELRQLLSAAADITGLTALRADANFAGVDGSGIGVAVIDTGTFASHPDLVNNFDVFFDATRDSANSPGSTNPASA